MHTYLYNNQKDQLKLSSTDPNQFNVKKDFDVLILYVGGFCGNAEYVRQLNEHDQNKFREITNDLWDETSSLRVKMLETTTPGFYKYIILHSSHQSEYYKNLDPINDENDFDGWLEFFYAITIGCLELVDLKNLNKAIFTHLTSLVRDDVVRAQGLALGRWWDKNGGSSTLQEIEFTGCGIDKEYIKMFSQVDPSEKLDLIINPTLNEEMMEWSCQVALDKTFVKDKNKIIPPRILKISASFIPDGFLPSEGELSYKHSSKSLASNILQPFFNANKPLITFSRIKSDFNDLLDVFKQNGLNLDTQLISQLEHLEEYETHEIEKFTFLRLPRSGHYKSQIEFLKRIIKDQNVEKLLIADIHFNFEGFKNADDLLDLVKDSIIRKVENQFDFELFVAWRFNTNFRENKFNMKFTLNE